MSAERVLTDGEIDAIEMGVGGAKPWVYVRRFARAVEAAMMAKLVLLSDGSYAVFRDGKPLITERDARKRERAAYVHGWQDCQGEGTRTYPKDRVDLCYPLPTCDKCGQEVK